MSADRCEACGARREDLAQCPDCARWLCQEHLTGKPLHYDEEPPPALCKPCALDDVANDAAAWRIADRKARMLERRKAARRAEARAERARRATA